MLGIFRRNGSLRTFVSGFSGHQSTVGAPAERLVRTTIIHINFNQHHALTYFNSSRKRERRCARRLQDFLKLSNISSSAITSKMGGDPRNKNLHRRTQPSTPKDAVQIPFLPQRPRLLHPRTLQHSPSISLVLAF
jgi:hypothetical protein